MNRQSDIDKKVNEALGSLDGIQRAEPAPWFFTRVKARLERDEKNVWETTGRFLSRPVIAVAGLCLILTLNAFFLFDKNSTTTTAANGIAQQEEESIFAAVNSIDYENLEP